MKYHPDIGKAKCQYETTEIDPIVIGQHAMFRTSIDQFQQAHGGDGGVDLWAAIQNMLGLDSE